MLLFEFQYFCLVEIETASCGTSVSCTFRSWPRFWSENLTSLSSYRSWSMECWSPLV